MVKSKKVSPKQTDEVKISKKRDKAKKDPNHVHESKGQSKALRYLKAWYAHQNGESEEWKFEKCRQIWLLQNCYDDKKVGKDEFKILLKYMKSIQGRMREGALNDAKKKKELKENWTKLIEEGKSEDKIREELGQEKLDEIVAKRASKIVKKLSIANEEIIDE